MPNKITILLDTNAYFRLADNLHPLFSGPFGVYDLKILGGTIGEYNFQSRLRTKFDWVMHQRHVDDRAKGVLRLRKEKRESVHDVWAFILSECRNRATNCSSFDIQCLATAYELGFWLVTDDRQLSQLADDYEVECLSMLELLSLMVEQRRLDVDAVHETVYLWNYNDDLPWNFHAEFLRIFGVPPAL